MDVVAEDSSLSSWLGELRYRTENYEPQFRHSLGSELSLLFCRPKDEMHPESSAATTSVYMHLWECTSQASKIHFAEERPVSTVFHEERVEEGEFAKPVKVEKVEFYLTKDVLDWITNLWYSSEEEDEFEEEILNNCAEYDQKHSNLNPSTRPEKFPISEDVVELRRTETIPNRREHAQTVHETSNTRKCFTAEGPYKLKGDNKTKLKVENGKVEVREHEVQFWSNGSLLRTEMIEGGIKIDKQISYKTKEGLREVIFKVPLSKHEPTVVDSKNFLRKFLRRRSDKHLLEKKGILKNENVFGNKLPVLKEKFGQTVPPFVKTIMAYIEQEENIRSEHIYRISGNMAVIQKIRLQIDENNFKILEKHVKDIEVLTGTLKLFYRELVDPILPYRDFEKLNKILDKVPEGDERSKQVMEVVDRIETPYRENLRELVTHLLKIEANSCYNKMTLKSLAIVWGPSVIWYQQDKCPNYNAIEFSMLANRVVELIFTSHRTVLTEQQSAEQPQRQELDAICEERIARSISEDDSSKSSLVSKVGGIFGLKRSESKEILSGSSWSLGSFGSESSKKANENPFCGYTLDMLPKKENETVPWVISEMIRLIETKLDVKDLYITTSSKDYMSKFRKKVTKSKPDISKIEPLDLAIILVKVLRELHDKLVPEEIFLDYCDNYERLNSDQRRQFVEESLQNLPEDKKAVLERIMEHLLGVFEHQRNRLAIANVWLPVFCNTTYINDQALTFTKLIFDYFEQKSSQKRDEPFEYKVRIRSEEGGGLKTTFLDVAGNQESSKALPAKENVKDGYSNAQLNSIADSLEKNAPHLSKYTSRWKGGTRKT